MCPDLMKLLKTTVLLKFSAARFLQGESTAEIWNYFMRIWVSMYLRFSKNISVDQGRQFESLECKSLVNTTVISKKSSEVEIHNA